LKPLSVTLPFAARFTDGEGSQPCAGAHPGISESEKRDSSGGAGRADAGAIFDLAPDYRLGVGPVSSKWLGDGGCKKGEDR